MLLWKYSVFQSPSGLKCRHGWHVECKMQSQIGDELSFEILLFQLLVNCGAMKFVISTHWTRCDGSLVVVMIMGNPVMARCC